jgi:hypothetical protein
MYNSFAQMIVCHSMREDLVAGRMIGIMTTLDERVRVQGLT